MGISMKKIAENEPFQMGNQVFEYRIEDGAIKLSKIKDIKARPSFTPPTLEEVETYFKSKGFTAKSASQFYDYYRDEDNPSAPWKDGKGQLIKDWKKKAKAVWFKDENKIKTPVKEQPTDKFLF